MFSVPPLTAKQPGPGLRALGIVLPGVRRVARQIEPYTAWWSDQNDHAVRATDGGTTGPLWFATGDSTCLGIGASSPTRGWVAEVRDDLRTVDGRWEVVNVAMSGARIADVLDHQITVLDELLAEGGAPRLVTCIVGTNDVLWSRSEAEALTDAIGELSDRLPAGSLVATVAGGSEKVRQANRRLRGAVVANGQHLVDPWREPGPGVRDRVADDLFHPNDTGHRLMADAFWRTARDVLDVTGSASDSA